MSVAHVGLEVLDVAELDLAVEAGDVVVLLPHGLQVVGLLVQRAGFQAVDCLRVTEERGMRME